MIRVTASMIKTIYVVMGNDFPDAVFSTREKADAFVAKREAENADPKNLGQRIFWSVYDFELDTHE